MRRPLRLVVALSSRHGRIVRSNKIKRIDCMTSPSTLQEISIAHSPDSDDAFMFYGLATNKVRVPGYKFTHTLQDIETLNHLATNEAFYDVTAISFHAYPYVQKDYALMACGGSVGENYGPMIVASQRIPASEIGRVRLAVP